MRPNFLQNNRSFIGNNFLSGKPAEQLRHKKDARKTLPSCYCNTQVVCPKIDQHLIKLFKNFSGKFIKFKTMRTQSNSQVKHTSFPLRKKNIQSMYEKSRIVPNSKRLPNQIGYQKRPIADAVLDVIETISKNLSVKDDFECTSVDFSKTFERGPSFDTFSENHFWLTDPKFFLKALSAPIYTNFEGECAPKNAIFLSKFFKKSPKNYLRLKQFFQSAKIGAKQCFGRARKVNLVDPKKMFSRKNF